ncbi:MAG: toprim domain-containing protein, partial [Planctomycetota bacterium]
DRFRNRLMFPIRDRAGRVIGFGGRALDEGQEPKYINSPETPLFSKKKCFYGFSQARGPMRDAGTAVVVEGYTDVIMAHQHGFENVLAVLGTALTEHHADALSRLCDRVVLVFDPDEAGRRSAERSIQVLLGEGIEIEVAELPEGQDPCDLLTEEGPEAFQQVLEESRDFLKFRLEAVAEQHDLDTMSGRDAAFRDLADMAAEVDDEPRRDLLVRRLAHEMGISEVSAWRHVRRAARRRRSRGRDDEGTGEEPTSPGSRWALDVTGFLLVHPDFLEPAVERIDTEMLEESEEVELLQKLLNRCEDDEEVSASGFMTALQDTGLSSKASSAVMAERKKDEYSDQAPQERFDTYMEFLSELEEKEDLSELSPARGARREDADDELLRAYEQKMRQRDKKQQGRIR